MTFCRHKLLIILKQELYRKDEIHTYYIIHVILSSSEAFGWNTLNDLTNSPNLITPLCLASKRSNTCNRLAWQTHYVYYLLDEIRVAWKLDGVLRWWIIWSQNRPVHNFHSILTRTNGLFNDQVKNATSTKLSEIECFRMSVLLMQLSDCLDNV